MIRSLKRKLYFLFAGSIMLVFTIVFFLLASENIETMRNAEVSFINRQATNLILLFENSADYAENLGICEKNYDYAFRLFTEENELLYESTLRNDTGETIDCFLETLASYESTESAESPDSSKSGGNPVSIDSAASGGNPVSADSSQSGGNPISIDSAASGGNPVSADSLEAGYSTQTGTHTFRSGNDRTYYGILCSIYTGSGYLHLAIVKEKSGITAFSSVMIRYFLIWLIVLIAVLLVSVLIIRQAMKPTEKAMQSQKNFIAAVSHELKTPLAVLLSATDVIEASPGCTTDIRSHAVLIETEISRMTRLIQDLLLLSSIDAGNWIFHTSKINVDTFLINLYDKFEMICNQKSINLQIRVPEECSPPLFSDEDRLSQIISIFLDNAISYSPKQSAILLEASVQKHHLAISIIDHGIGISEEDKRHIFDRFYRCDKSRTQKGHYGLGLSVANELVSLLGGKISLSDTPGGGCTFTISIPWNSTE